MLGWGWGIPPCYAGVGLGHSSLLPVDKQLLVECESRNAHRVNCCAATLPKTLPNTK